MQAKPIILIRIYMDAVNEAQCRVGAKKSRKQYEVKQNTIQANSVEWAA